MEEHCTFCLTHPNSSSPGRCKTMQEAAKCSWHPMVARDHPAPDASRPWVPNGTVRQFKIPC